MDLAAHACLHFSGLRWGNVWMMRRDDQTVRIPIVPRYLANDGISLRDVAVAGAGITLLPMFEIIQELRDGRLVRLLEDWTIGSVPIHAVFPANKHIASKVRRFTDFLIKRLPRMRWRSETLRQFPQCLREPAWRKPVATLCPRQNASGAMI